METKYKAIVFDYGGVLEFFSKNNPNKTAANLLSIPFESFRDEYFKHNYLSNIENVPWEKMFEQVVSVFSESNEVTKKIMSEVNKDRQQHTLNKELINALPNLKTKGFKVGLLSNNTTTLREQMKNNGLLPLFDKIVISAEIKYQKPDKEAFSILFKELDLKPEEVIFIDDSTKSLESAKNIGYYPINFSNNKQLKSDLHNLGIDLILKS